LVVTNATIVIGVGLIIFFGHNILDYATIPDKGLASVLIPMFLTCTVKIYPLTSDHVFAQFYAILPWTCLMLLGYGVGSFYRPSFDPSKRKKILFTTGIALIILFILLRAINIYGDPAPWSTQKNEFYTLLSFLNTTKYPPSLLFHCMTLGPI